MKHITFGMVCLLFMFMHQKMCISTLDYMHDVIYVFMDKDLIFGPVLVFLVFPSFMCYLFFLYVTRLNKNMIYHTYPEPPRKKMGF